jgi:hypothetical protein
VDICLLITRYFASLLKISRFSAVGELQRGLLKVPALSGGSGMVFGKKCLAFLELQAQQA